MTKLRKRADRSQRERGAVLVLTALVMILLLFIAAFATDLGAWYRQGQEQQRAADVSALNGVQAYDRAVKQYFQSLEAAAPPRSVKNWSDLTTTETAEAEVAGMREAAETVIGLLETSGLSFSNSGSPSIAFDPTDVTQISTWTVVATNGTTVVITRSFQQTDVDAAGNPIYGRAISVDVQAPGEQYFSNILRDAPQIERSAESVLSNCGAECTRSIELDPPFAGFNAAGSGDGYKPLLYDRDNDLVNGYEQVWAVNHHVRSNSAGDIICMDTETQVSCGSWSINANGYNSANRPVELLSNRVNKIYAPMTDRSTSVLRGGVLCYDVERYQPCTTEFIDLWGSGGGSGGHTSTVGVWEWDNQLWVLSHHGTIACVTMSADATGGMQPCSGTNTWDTAIVGHGDTPNPTDTPRMGWGEIINGDELFIVQRDKNNKPVFTCFDLGSKNDCWSGSGRRTIPTPNDYNKSEPMGFFRYTTGGSISGVCIAEPQDNAHYCFDLNGNNGGSPLSNFGSNVLNPMGTGWQGSAHYWTNGESGTLLQHRTFFSGGRSDMAGCWDWKTNSSCGPIDMDVFVPGNAKSGDSGITRANSEEIFPYGMSTITDECIIGLGDQSIFYSFNPISLSACVDTQVSTQILPCDCADGVNKRWGEVRMPADLLAVVNRLDGTVTDPATGTEYLSNEDLLANGGVLDLSGVPDTVPLLMLNLVIDAKLGVDDKPLWQSPITFDLRIVVQPTLTN